MTATEAELPVTGPYVVDGVIANLIAGTWRDAAESGRRPDIDPAAAIPLIESADSGPEDASAALAAAAAALPSWRATSVFERADIVNRAAALVRQRADELARLMTAEEGKPHAEALGEVIRTAETLEVFAGLAYLPSGEVHSGHRPADQWTFTRSVPLGVVVVIAPWNFPLMIPAWKSVAACITGNTVVLKPSEETPLCAAALAAILTEAGLPPGVLNVVHGNGGVLGPALLHAPAVAVSFTGGDVAGAAVARAAVEQHLKCQLELGGNNPVLVLDDADLDAATREIVAGATSSTGQKCTATRRVFVTVAVYDALVDRLDRALRSRLLGPGRDDRTHIGPLINARAKKAFEAAVTEATDAGYTVRRYGDVPAEGHFVAPTLVLEPDPEADVVRRETFGPLVSIMKVTDLTEGITRCNATSFGLSASVFSSSIVSAIRFTEEIEAGMVHVNSQTTGAEPHLPFGGVKGSSNFSRELGRWGLEWYTQTKAVYVEG